VKKHKVDHHRILEPTKENNEKQQQNKDEFE